MIFKVLENVIEILACRKKSAKNYFYIRCTQKHFLEWLLLSLANVGASRLVQRDKTFFSNLLVYLINIRSNKKATVLNSLYKNETFVMLLK